MTSRSKTNQKRTVKPPLDRFGGVRVVQRRIQKSETIEQNKEAVAKELIAIATANITDVISWDETGRVTVKDALSLSDAAVKSIKKIKVTPTKEGPQLEIEMHDKVAVLRILAKAAGLLETPEDIDKPSVVGIVMRGPDTTPETIEVETLDDQHEEGLSR